MKLIYFIDKLFYGELCRKNVPECSVKMTAV